MEIYLYEVVFEVAADDAQSGGKMLEKALDDMPVQEILAYEISEEVTLVRTAFAGPKTMRFPIFGLRTRCRMTEHRCASLISGMLIERRST